MELTIILICLAAALVLLFRVLAQLGRHAGGEQSPSPKHVTMTCGCPRQHKLEVGGQSVHCPACGYLMAAWQENDGWIHRRFQYVG